MNAKTTFFGTAKQTVKKYRHSKNKIIKFSLLFLSFIWNATQTIKRICVDKDFRSLALLQLLHPNKVHQTTPLTFMDRYPAIFSACKNYFNGKQDLKILSYGCSTGEEVLTLRKYFPDAELIGADINKQSLAICRQLPVDKNISFLYSSHSEIKKHGPFDAIFCMAVLQRKPHDIAAKGITNLKKIYPFDKFEQQIIEFDQIIKPQGLMVIHYTQYSFEDTSLASNYKSLGYYNQSDYHSPVFDKKGELIKNPPPQKSIFIKL
ncbi:MAG: class I SAM-dependent methyltransferase [Anaerobacillus sp.]|uniref:class I SAM-dependent methyltransferase n=1 Tax=Anaerobacillus sp. TaxID=1872506 RepID=UPI0039197E59